MFSYVIAHSGRFGRLLHSLKADKSGIAALEYGILAGMAAVVVVAATAGFGTSLTALFGRLDTVVGSIAP